MTTSLKKAGPKRRLRTHGRFEAPWVKSRTPTVVHNWTLQYVCAVIPCSHNTVGPYIAAGLVARWHQYKREVARRKNIALAGGGDEGSNPCISTMNRGRDQANGFGRTSWSYSWHSLCHCEDRSDDSRRTLL